MLLYLMDIIETTTTDSVCYVQFIDQNKQQIVIKIDIKISSHWPAGSEENIEVR